MTPTACPSPIRALWHRIQVPLADDSIGSYLDTAAPHQRRFLDAIEPALLRLCGRRVPSPPGEPIKTRFVQQRHRGASKSTDAMLAALSVFYLANRPLRILLISTDADAARVLIQISTRIVRLNARLEERTRLDRWKLTNTVTGSEIEVLSSDAASFYGQLPDMIVADEFTHWGSPTQWEAVASTLPKKTNLVFLSLFNAGWLDSWQRPVFEAFADVPHCWVDVMEEHAPWMTAEHLDAQRKLLPPLAFERLYMNRWAPCIGSAARPTPRRSPGNYCWNRPTSY